MTFGSLFDGVGCYSLGLLRAGMRCLWTVEIDPRCREVTALRFPGVAQHEDVREVGANNLEPVDVLVGASPCQDLSVAGKGRGLAGERSGLLREMARVALELRPRWLVWENVPGAFSSNQGRDFAAVLGELTGCEPAVPRKAPGVKGGWRNSGVCVGPYSCAAWRVLDVRHYGLAQRRKRIYLVARLGDGGRLLGEAPVEDQRRLAGLPLQVLFEPESVCWDPPEGGEAGQGPAAGAAGRAGPEGRGPRVTAFTQNQRDEVRSTGGQVGARPAERGSKQQAYLAVGGELSHSLTTKARGATEDGTGRGTPILVEAPAAFQSTGAGYWREEGLQVSAGDDNGTNSVVVEPVTFRHTTGPNDGGTHEDGVASMVTPKTQPAVAFMCQGSNVGPAGTLRAGSGSVAGGVPFIHDQVNQQPRGDLYACGTCGHRGRHLEHATACPECGEADYENVMVRPTVGPNAGMAFDFRAQEYLPSGRPDAEVVAVQDGRGHDKRQNGSGGGRPGGPAFTLDTTGAQAVSSGLVVRRLTPTECLRLMGLPDKLTWRVVIRTCSEEQKSLVIADSQSRKWQNSALPALLSLAEIKPGLPAPSAALHSALKPQLGGRRAVVLADTSLPTGGLLLRSWPGESPPHAGSAANFVSYQTRECGQGFAHAAARMSSILGLITATGRADCTKDTESFIAHQSGCAVVVLPSEEIRTLANDAAPCTQKAAGLSKSTTSEVGDTSLSYGSQLITLCCSVVRAMTGLSRLTIPLVSSSDIVLTISGDWFSGVKLSDSKKYHMIGNGGAPQVMEWVGRRIILAERDGHVGDPEKGQQG